MKLKYIYLMIWIILIGVFFVIGIFVGIEASAINFAKLTNIALRDSTISINLNETKLLEGLDSIVNRTIFTLNQSINKANNITLTNGN